MNKELKVTCLNINCPERKGGKCFGEMKWEERFGFEFPKWDEPKPGAGKELGALAGTGMYMQYDVDRMHRDLEVEKIKEFIKSTVIRNERFDLLIKVLADCETAKDARECRHIIKDYILGEK